MSLKHENEILLSKKKKKGLQLPLPVFLQIIIITIFVLFFLVIYTLMKSQSSIMTSQSDLQVQGEVSSTVEEQVQNFLNNASSQLQTLYRIFDETEVFASGFDEDVLVSIIKSMVSENKNINALYFGDENGNFYMVKRIAHDFDNESEVSTRIVKNDGKQIVERWIHNKNIKNSLLAKYKSYQVSTSEKGYDPRRRPWYKVAKENNVSWTAPYIFYTDSLLGITATRKISNDKISGVLAVDLSLSYITDYIRTIPFSSLGNIVVSTQDKKLIALNDKTNQEFSKIYKEYITLDNEKKTDVLYISDVDSSPEMHFFGETIMSLSESELLALESPEKNNVIEVLLSLIYPKYSRSEHIRTLLLNGLTTGKITHDSGEFIYTHRIFEPSPEVEWSIYTMTDALNINGSWEYITKIVTWIFLLFVVLFIFTMYQASKTISTPLTNLMVLMSDIKNLVLGKRFQNKSFVKISEIEEIGEICNGMQQSFSFVKKFVPEAIVKRSLDSSLELHTGMSQKQGVGFLFSDIKGFTPITERTDPETLFQCLEIYFSEMSQAVYQQHGIIDKFIGDAIMAIYGAFDDTENISERLAYTALLMQQKEQIINEKIKQITPDIQFHTRIGLHKGDVMLGIIGSDVKLNYTAVGDSVNLASRLEATNKEFGTRITVSSSIRDDIVDKFVFRFLGSIQVKGKKLFVKAYQLIGTIENVPQDMQAYIKEYERAYELVEQGKHAQAKKIIQNIEDNDLYQDINDGLLDDLKNKVE